MVSWLLSNQRDSAARNFLFSSLGWLIVAPLIGVFISIHMTSPDWYRAVVPVDSLSFGRLRPTHVLGVTFGWMSAAFLAAFYYMIPRMLRTRLWSERLGNLTMWLWNIVVLGGEVSLALGYNQGREWAEFPFVVDVAVVVVLVLIAVNLTGTLRQRREKQLYVSLWYFYGSLFWMPIVYIVGNAMWNPSSGAVRGINDAALNWFLGHNIIGLWLTTAGLGIAYYVLPRFVGQPIYSHRLSLIGFWTIAFAYGWTGQHHIIWGPGPDWLESVAIVFSVMLIIPVFTVLYNLYKTTEGRWATFFKDPGFKFLLLGLFAYLLTCLQGPLQALRSINQYTHFTNWTVGHAHLAIMGFATPVAVAGIYYMFPRLAKRQLYSLRLANYHFWLSTIAIGTLVTVLFVGGLIQGSMWITAARLGQPLPPVDVTASQHPYYFIRMVAGIVFWAAQIPFVVNVYQTFKAGAPLEERRPEEVLVAFAQQPATPPA